MLHEEVLPPNLVIELTLRVDDCCFRPRLTVGRLGEFLRREVFDGANAVDELAHVQLGIGVEVHSSDNCEEQPIVREDAALDEEPLEIDLINILVVPIIH